MIIRRTLALTEEDWQRLEARARGAGCDGWHAYVRSLAQDASAHAAAVEVIAGRKQPKAKTTACTTPAVCTTQLSLDPRSSTLPDRSRAVPVGKGAKS